MERCSKCSRMVDDLIKTQNEIWSGSRICYSCNLKMVREELAAYAHKAWSGWMDYLFEKSTLNPDGTVTIPVWAVERWKKQAKTPYIELSENEKENDRNEAYSMLKILNF